MSTQSENAAADHKEEESKKKMKKVVAKLDKVIKEEIKERPNLAAASELIEKVCKYKRLCEKKNRKFWKLILTARRQFEAMKERENELPNTMKQDHRELEAELKGKEEKIQVLREEKRAWEEEKDVLMAEKASLFERVQTLEKMIAALSQDTNGQGMMEKEEEVENRKLQDENALLIEENALLSRKVKELQNFIDGNKDENREYPINNSPDRDEEEPSQCRTEVIGDYESMYTAPEDQQMPSQTIEVGDYEKDWQLVEFVGVKSPAHEDYEMGSQTVNNAANVDNGLTDCGTPKKMGWPTFDLCMGLSPAIEQPKDQHTPTVQPLAQDWESPRVLSVEILSPTPESPAPITTTDDIVLYSYVVRLKNRKRVQKKDKIYWYEKPKKKKGGEKKKKGGEKKKKDKDWFVCASPITAIDEKKNLEIHYVSDDEDGEDKQMDTLDWTRHVVFNMMDTAAQKKLHEYWNKAELG